MAMRIAQASALKADSALWDGQPMRSGWRGMRDPHVVIIFPSNQINVERNASSKGEGLKEMGDHFRRH